MLKEQCACQIALGTRTENVPHWRIVASWLAITCTRTGTFYLPVAHQTAWGCSLKPSTFSVGRLPCCFSIFSPTAMMHSFTMLQGGIRKQSRLVSQLVFSLPTLQPSERFLEIHKPTASSDNRNLFWLYAFCICSRVVFEYWWNGCYKWKAEKTTHEKISKAMAKLKSRWLSALKRSMNFRFEKLEYGAKYTWKLPTAIMLHAEATDWRHPPVPPWRETNC